MYIKYIYVFLMMTMGGVQLAHYLMISTNLHAHVNAQIKLHECKNKHLSKYKDGYKGECK